MVNSSLKRMFKVVPVALVAAVAVVQAQEPIAPGKYWSAQRIQGGLKEGTLGAVAGLTVTPYPGVVIRKRIEGPNNASVHAWDTDGVEMDEITFIIDGVGTFMTGGNPPDYKNRTAGIKGGEAHEVHPGDIFVVPAGTPHWFSTIKGHVTMMEFRFPSERTKKKGSPAKMTAPMKPGTYWPASEIQAKLKAGDLGAVAGLTVEPYPGLSIRKRLEGPNNASVHAFHTDGVEMDEITYIIDGQGTFMTGGIGPDYNNRTAGIKGGESHDVKPGDIFVVPAGTPHWFSSIKGHVTMMEFRFPSLRSLGNLNDLPKPDPPKAK